MVSAAVVISTPFARGKARTTWKTEIMPEDVLIQATRSGVRIMLAEGQPTADALAELQGRLGGEPALTGTAVTLVLASVMAPDDLTALESLLIGQHGATCIEVVRAAAVEAAATRSAMPSPGTSPVSRPPATRGLDGPGDSLLVRRTLRSGQRIRFAGNVIVLGDVNPGAEIVAGGDIVVMGTLRGVAHAGVSGDAEAIVAAFRLQPTQIRVGGVIGRSPDGAYDRPDVPEIARVRDGLLVVERLQPSFGDALAASGAFAGSGGAAATGPGVAGGGLPPAASGSRRGDAARGRPRGANRSAADTAAPSPGAEAPATEPAGLAGEAAGQLEWQGR